MRRLAAREREELVALYRELSPESLAVSPPELGPLLEPLVGAGLPRRPRALLFDVYGTLVMSAAGGKPRLLGEVGAAGDAVRARSILAQELGALGYEGSEAVFEREVLELGETMRTRARAATASPEIDIETLVGAVLPGIRGARLRRLALVFEAARNPCAPMPGARALLKRLSTLPLRLGLVSNAQFYTPLLLEALFGASPTRLGFEAKLLSFSYELGVAKPDPAPFLRAMGPLLDSGLSPGEILVVGNSSVNDIAPAKNLGMMTALFAGDIRSFRPSAPGSPGARPDTILRDYEGLESLFPSA